MINIDGSYGEGGGQIVRTCLTLSAITGKPFTLSPIRPNREKSGLMPQHLMACVAVSQVCQGKLDGAALGSSRLIFKPDRIQGGHYTFDIGTAGSTILLAQTIIPVFLYASTRSTVRITGGTHVMKSPGYDYFQEVFLPAIAQFGVLVKSKMSRVGYYPRGGGKLELDITPQPLHGCTMWKSTHGPLAIIRLSRLPRHIAERESKALLHHGIKNIVIHEDDSFSPGNAITLCEGFKGVDALGEVGKKAEQVADDIVALFEEEKKADVDKHLADQLLVYAALAKGKTSYTTTSMTEHLRTNVFIISRFIDRRISIVDNPKQTTRGIFDKLSLIDVI